MVRDVVRASLLTLTSTRKKEIQVNMMGVMNNVRTSENSTSLKTRRINSTYEWHTSQLRFRQLASVMCLHILQHSVSDPSSACLTTITFALPVSPNLSRPYHSLPRAMATRLKACPRHHTLPGAEDGREDPCPPPDGPACGRGCSIDNPAPPTAATSGAPHPPLLAGAEATPLPLATSVPDDPDAAAGAPPPAAEREGAATSPPTAATVAQDLARDA